MPKTTSLRKPKTPPHVSLAALRRASGMTLEQVADSVTEILQCKPVNRGTIAAIESGIRGASDAMLDALAIAYGMRPGDLTTDYAPRKRELDEAVGL